MITKPSTRGANDTPCAGSSSSTSRVARGPARLMIESLPCGSWTTARLPHSSGICTLTKAWLPIRRFISFISQQGPETPKLLIVCQIGLPFILAEERRRIARLTAPSCRGDLCPGSLVLPGQHGHVDGSRCVGLSAQLNEH